MHSTCAMITLAILALRFMLCKADTTTVVVNYKWNEKVQDLAGDVTISMPRTGGCKMGGFLKQHMKAKCDDLPTRNLKTRGNSTDKIMDEKYNTFGIWKISKQSCDSRMDHEFTIQKGDDIYKRLVISINRHDIKHITNECRFVATQTAKIPMIYPKLFAFRFFRDSGYE
ncbi:hypothetical protein CROQUDRAFT_88321 [Cronartium quercuum f. sp. fusiforme G11]|uniref:Lipocalin n=1 Tax=Cronartium quercuum f. sp. fusiforme G11 TaxID=708437 RepID=A0A9P6TFT1_9BASI|nr:hypothetical protein CROQUDRAFT_88321 [Cronartium quercuum f. sp. fusiforme G11]